MSYPATRYYLQLGLTLVELLVALTVLVLLVTQAAPAFHKLYLKQLLRSQSNLLYSSLIQARSEAIKRGQPITLCASMGDSQCATNQSNWSQGWLLFSDLNNNRQYDADEPRLQLTKLSATSPALLWNRKRSIRFDNRGQSKGYNGSFTLCAGASQPMSRKIILSNTGRARIDTKPQPDACRSSVIAAN